MDFRHKTLFRLIMATALGVSMPARAGERPHLDLETTSEEYRVLVDRLVSIEADDPLAAIIAVGKRNLDWIQFINAARPAGQKLELSTPATQVGYPIDQPTQSNRTIVTQLWEAVRAGLPPVPKAVLVDGADFTVDLALTDDEFLRHARLVDRAYQRASRWLLQEPYLIAYASEAADDVRGYYFLRQDPKLLEKLRGWQKLDVATKINFKGWLVGQCRNADRTDKECREELSHVLLRDGHALAFHTKYVAKAQQHWNSYFQITKTRRDVIWTAEPTEVMTVPFKNPGREDVVTWLRDNIEDEWKWGTWHLTLDFQEEGDEDTTHVVFQPGATPHVNDLAGSEITMDANRSLNEYSSRWTIRHEYGHVLGFPDCYLEFYDEPAGVMISYQLDVTNLMCSRTGKLQEKHFAELKRVYARAN